jgi:hypothetical protein
MKKPAVLLPATGELVASHSCLSLRAWLIAANSPKPMQAKQFCELFGNLLPLCCGAV